MIECEHLEEVAESGLQTPRSLSDGGCEKGSMTALSAHAVHRNEAEGHPGFVFPKVKHFHGLRPHFSAAQKIQIMGGTRVDGGGSGQNRGVRALPPRACD